MTDLDKPVRRVTRGALDCCYGKDRGRRLIATLDVGDLVVLRPHGTRRSETVSLFDVYRYAMQRRVNCTRMEKLRAKKEKKATRLAAVRYKRSISKPISL